MKEDSQLSQWLEIIMNVLLRPGGVRQRLRYLIAIVCTISLVACNAPVYAQQSQAQQPQARQPTEEGAKIPPDQLDALVAPIALYPDPLLSQTLVASTYPLEIMQLQQWLQKNKGLSEKALADAVAKQPWDPSIQAMAALPQVVKRLADDIQWTTDLGNAFLAQQSDVMDAVQRMRVKAKSTGALASNEKQKVETKEIDSKTVVVVGQAQPKVVYVPEYNPVAVYGPALYPYPPIYYPAYTPGAVIASSAISFGVGVAMGAAWGGGWGWGAGWGHNDIDVNFNNSFNRSANVNRNRTANNTWRHNPQHRGGEPYSNRATANRFGSTAGGGSLANRQKGAQQQIARQKGNLGSVSARGLGTRPSGGDRIGNRSVGRGSSMGDRGGFAGGSRSFNGGAARANSRRGASSLGARSGGGGRARGGGRR